MSTVSKHDRLQFPLAVLVQARCGFDPERLLLKKGPPSSRMHRSRGAAVARESGRARGPRLFANTNRQSTKLGLSPCLSDDGEQTVPGAFPRLAPGC